MDTEGKPIPTELRSDEAELRKAIEFDDEAHESKFDNDCCQEGSDLLHSRSNNFQVLCKPCLSICNSHILTHTLKIT